MQIAGIITEYNPLHIGHVWMLEQVRDRLGPDCGVICAMSGNFVQRGDAALVRKHARAEAAVKSGADLVLELPLPWAVSSAEGFAEGGVRTLLATGLVTHLAFGSECGDADALLSLARALESSAFSELLKEELAAGDSFAAARQRTVERLTSTEDAALLSQPNNTLGVEYCRALLRAGSDVRPLTIPRRGAAHDGEPVEGIASASAIRQLVREGDRAEPLALMAPAMAAVYQREEAAGRAPVLLDACERAILARLRTMEETDFAALDQGKEGMYHRLYDASRDAATLAELLDTAKTKRYAYARLRRMVLWAWLGLTPADVPEGPLYLRPLAANEKGRALLARMRKTASIPILTKPADARRLSPEACRLFGLEARATDLYTLAYPQLSAAKGGAEWREGPVIL